VDVSERDSGLRLAELVAAFSLAMDLGLGQPMEHVSAMHRLRLAVNLVATGGSAIERGMLSHCLTTGRMAERIGLGTDVRDPLQHFFARWDGKGVPGGIGGEAIALPMRLFHLADIVEVFHRAEGTDAAVEVARDRRGRQFDPAVVDVFCAVAKDVLGDPATELDWHALIAEEPALQRRLSERELDAALEAIADFTDLRSPSRAGHSRGVSDLAARAAAHAGLRDAEIVTVCLPADLPGAEAGRSDDCGRHLPGTSGTGGRSPRHRSVDRLNRRCPGVCRVGDGDHRRRSRRCRARESARPLQRCKRRGKC
jgi:HD domain